MGRKKNSEDTVRITLSTTEMMGVYLDICAGLGTWGKNRAEAAERLLGAKIEDIRNAGGLLGEALDNATKAAWSEKT